MIRGYAGLRRRNVYDDGLDNLLLGLSLVHPTHEDDDSDPDAF